MEVPNDSDKVSTAVLAERLRMYMQINTKSLDAIGEEVHNVAVGVEGLQGRHERLADRMTGVEGRLDEVKDQVSKRVPILWFRSAWSVVLSILGLIGLILTVIVSLQKIGVLQ